MANDHPLISPPGNRPNVNENVLLWNIFLALTGGVPGSPVVPVFSGGGGSQTVTPHFVSVSASASGTIPSGAKGWTFTVVSGTATFGGVSVPAGFSDSDTNTLSSAISYSTSSASSAYVRYNT